jgi:hydroxyacylglutathione hydrolase
MNSFKSSQILDWSVYGITAFQNNYLWAIVNEQNNNCWVVDPGCAHSVQWFLNLHAYHLSGILVTHHHSDHIGGIDQLLKWTQTALPVYGPATKNIPQVNRPVKEGDSLIIEGLTVQILEVPGHTLDHMAYVINIKNTPNNHSTWIFCGDTLFSAGCGRLFEGSPEQMFRSIQKLNQFPDESLLFCAHEYTESNLKFARSFAPQCKNIKRRELEVQQLRKNNQSTIPSTLAIERLSNLFLNAANPIEFKKIREAKDHFQ